MCDKTQDGFLDLKTNLFLNDMELYKKLVKIKNPAVVEKLLACIMGFSVPLEFINCSTDQYKYEDPEHRKASEATWKTLYEKECTGQFQTLVNLMPLSAYRINLLAKEIFIARNDSMFSVWPIQDHVLCHNNPVIVSNSDAEVSLLSQSVRHITNGFKAYICGFKVLNDNGERTSQLDAVIAKIDEFINKQEDRVLIPCVDEWRMKCVSLIKLISGIRSPYTVFEAFNKPGNVSLFTDEPSVKYFANTLLEYALEPVLKSRKELQTTISCFQDSDKFFARPEIFEIFRNTKWVPAFIMHEKRLKEQQLLEAQRDLDRKLSSASPYRVMDLLS